MSKSTTTKHNLSKIVSNNLFMLRYVILYTPAYFVSICLFEIFSSIELFFEFTYCTKYIIDLIQYGGEFYQAANYLLFVTTIIIIKVGWGAILNHKITPVAKEKLHKKMQEELYANAVRLDLSKYDNPDYYNEFVWSVGEASSRMDALLSDVTGLLSRITAILVTGAFIITFNKVGLIFVFVSLLITFLSNSTITKLQFKMDLEMKPIQRKRNYFNRVFYLNDYAKEIRLNPISEQLKLQFHEENNKVYPIVKKYGRKQTIMGIIGDYLPNDILFSSYLIYLIYQAIMKAAFGYGTMLSLYNSANNLKWDLRNITVLLTKFQQHSFYVEKIRTFLAFQPEIPDGTLSVDGNCFQQLSLENVSFGYRKDEPILKNISLTISAGEKIAFVGYNGAGKTTLTKLLMRLYDVNSGSISLNGQDIREFKKEEYRDLFGSVFQDYRIYAASIEENVKMDLIKESDEKEILQALKKSDFSERLNQMNLGLKTNITREFSDEGTNLSGGEMQKIAIARVFVKTFPIIILDEPSSALDPVSEYNLNETMLKAAENKTVVFISHRLSSTKMADRIYMLEEGRIIESGSHKELMELDGKYAKMFRMQAQRYHIVKKVTF